MNQGIDILKCWLPSSQSSGNNINILQTKIEGHAIAMCCHAHTYIYIKYDPSNSD